MVTATEGAAPGPLETTQALLMRVRHGDDAARDSLVRRFLPGLQRWARGRLPAHARDMLDTDDLVQVSLLRALARIDLFQPEREGAFLAYLHKTLLNCLRDEVRRVRRGPSRTAYDDGLLEHRPAGGSASAGAIDAYERSLALLPPEHQHAVILRIEFGFTYQEIADALGRPSANAVRMQLTRDLVRLAKAMHGSV